MTEPKNVQRVSGVIRGITCAPGTKVEVEWQDSERVTLGWATVETYAEALADRTVYRTCGYLMGSTPEYVLIALNRSDSGLVGEAMVIPLVCITSIVWLAPS